MKTPARWTRLSSALLVCALISVMSAIAGCGGDEPTPTTVAGVSSAPGELTTYIDDDLGFSFSHPQSWRTDEGPSADVSSGGQAIKTVSVYDPDGAQAEDVYIDLAQISVYRLNLIVDDSVMDELEAEVRTVLTALEDQADLQKIEDLAGIEINGMKGFQATYGLVKNGAPVISTLYFLFSGDTEYQVTAQAADENWEAAKPVFEALVASFQPGPAAQD